LGNEAGYGWLKVSNLWRPKPFKLVMLGSEWPEEPPQGYVHRTVAELALLELTAAMPASLAEALKSEPADEDDEADRFQTLFSQLDDRRWGEVDWFVCQTRYNDEERERIAINLGFTDGSELFITVHGFSLERPRWVHKDDASPDVLKVAGLQPDTPCWGTA
jgi:hypothetical protein